MKPQKLDDDVLSAQLSTLPSWTLKEGKLHREFRFKDFVTAFDFMTKVASIAEAMNHHPEWFNVYATVRVDLATHDVGGISSLDIELARRMSALADTTQDA